eukprot:2510325-Pleurochrysis_carterae.AAC.1
MIHNTAAYRPGAVRFGREDRIVQICAVGERAGAGTERACAMVLGLACSNSNAQAATRSLGSGARALCEYACGPGSRWELCMR